MDDSEIEEESRLADYTDSHFMNKMNVAMMEQFRNHDNERSNSPVIFSNSSSNNSSDDDIESAKFHKLTYTEIDRSFNQYNPDSDELDILITYLNGQKNLYTYSCKFVQYKLHMLMIPTLVLTSASTLLAPFIMEYRWSGAIISSMNATVLFLIVLCNYFKLESAYNSYSLLSSQYSNLHASLTMGNTRYTTNAGYNEVVAAKIIEFERKIHDIRDSINIPSEIKLVLPIISHINIFSFVKHIETYKRSLIIRYRDVKNEIRYINQRGGENGRKKTRYTFLLTIKDKLKDEIIQYKNIYNVIDLIFTQEIKKVETYKWYWLWIIIVGIGPTQYDTNSIVYRHLSL
jgi:hypothetical protein